jgi:hypothetical protein
MRKPGDAFFRTSKRSPKNVAPIEIAAVDLRPRGVRLR